MGKLKKTSVPGIFRLPSGQIRIRVGMRMANHGDRKMFRQLTLPKGTLLKEAKKRKEELEADLERLGNEIEIQTQSPPESNELLTPTLRDYAERWIARGVGWKKRSTVERDISYVSHHIFPFLGDRHVGELRRRDIEEWLDTVQKTRKSNGAPYSPHSIHAWFRLLREILRDAAADYDLRDPTRRIRCDRLLSGKAVRERVTLSGQQVADLLDAVSERYSDWFPEIYFLAHTGLRPGELYALQRGDFDFGLGIATVSRAHWRGTISTPKTGVGRVVAFPPSVGQVVLAYWRRRDLLDGSVADSDSLAFPNENGGIRFDSTLRHVLASASKRAVLPIRVTPQVIRRTVNTRLLAAGVPETVIRTMIGHSSAQMTQLYAGVRPETKQRAVERIAVQVSIPKKYAGNCWKEGAVAQNYPNVAQGAENTGETRQLKSQSWGENTDTWDSFGIVFDAKNYPKSGKLDTKIQTPSRANSDGDGLSEESDA